MENDNSEHLKLSNYIKSVHSKLRYMTKSIGFQKAWTYHCDNEETLKEYASAMKKLATYHWQRSFDQNLKATSRIEWVYHFCLSYFSNEQESVLLKQREREVQIAKKVELNLDVPYLVYHEKLRLLDVGSCYNPFGAFNLFEVLSIDIAPAHSDVTKMDFLNVQIEESLDQISSKTLPKNFFHIVVFSLFLEYIPTPVLRLQCCKNAYDVLIPEGLLFVITPDSKHVGANAHIMKSWRWVLAQIGFSRIKYEKLPHIHCMVFRRSLDLKISKRWADLHSNDNLLDNMYIPQDLSAEKQTNESQDESTKQIGHSKLVYDDLNLCGELPFSANSAYL